MPSTVSRVLKTTSGVVLSAVLLVGCSEEPEVPMAAQKQPPAQPVTEESSANTSESEVLPPDPSTVTGMKYLTSADAPFACDLLTTEDVASVVGVDEVEMFDTTQHRRDWGAWTDSTCMYGFGENKDPYKVNLQSRFVRVDVYTESSLQKAGWGSLQEQWMVRSEHNQRRFDFHEGVWAAWVESDHPPDPALLIRKGEVMIELAHYPPRSAARDVERNKQIERIAKIMLEKQEAPDEE